MNRVFNTWGGLRIYFVILKMNSETFTMRKNLLEEFYKERTKLNINKIEIYQDSPEISINEYENNIFFKTHINFTNKEFLISDVYKHLKPIIYYAYSYTIKKKFFRENFILIEDDTVIKYNFENDNNEVYIKNLEVVLNTHYDFQDVDYDFYFEALGELEENNELVVSHTEPINEEVKIINPTKIFKSDECIICLTTPPKVLFCNCGHLCLCTECGEIKSLSDCPICKTENKIIRMLE